MLAAFASSQSAADPLAGLEVGERPEPDPPPGWEVIEVRAASVNRHDLWSLQGPPLAADRLPMILGTDAAGTGGDGRRLVAYPVIGPYPGRWHLLSEGPPGTLAERVAVPAENLVEIPPELTFEEAACLPTAYLTAFRMLFTRGGVGPGDRVLVQGATGGVATAAIILAGGVGAEVYATSRSERGRGLARSLGAVPCQPGERLPQRVDVAIETVGAPTLAHSVAAVRNEGRVVVAGATGGSRLEIDLERLFLRQISVVGSSMGTRQELQALIDFLIAANLRPAIGRVFELGEAEEAFRAVAEDQPCGKVVVQRR